MNKITLIKLSVTLIIFHISIFTHGQNTKFLGKVIDSETKKPVANAHIIIKGTTTGTNSNFRGYFELTGSNQEIVVSHVGYEKVVAKLNSENTNFLLTIPPKTINLQVLRMVDFDKIESFEYDQELFSREITNRSNKNSPLELTAGFPGRRGLKSFHNYLRKGLFKIGDSITTNHIHVYFSILKDGRLKVDSISKTSYNKRIRELFENSPKWVPAFQRHTPVITSFKQSLIFENSPVYEEQAEYIDGMQGFYDFISDNMKYPLAAKKEGVEGLVYISFVIDKSGEVQEVKTEKTLGYGCDEEAVRLINLTSGQWKPAKLNGEPTKTQRVLPIRFTL